MINQADPADNGKIENSYVNVDGNYNANLFGNLGLPIIKGNKLNLQINGGLSLNKRTNFSAMDENITQNLSVSNGYKLVSNLDKLDLIAGISGRWDRGTYTIGNTTTTILYLLISISVMYSLGKYVYKQISRIIDLQEEVLLTIPITLQLTLT